MASTQSECEHIARELGLKDTTATIRVDSKNDCHNNRYYRCSYDGVGVHETLYWNPNCGDNVDPSRYSRNLCMPGR